MELIDEWFVNKILQIRQWSINKVTTNYKENYKDQTMFVICCYSLRKCSSGTCSPGCARDMSIRCRFK